MRLLVHTTGSRLCVFCDCRCRLGFPPSLALFPPLITRDLINESLVLLHGHLQSGASALVSVPQQLFSRLVPDAHEHAARCSLMSPCVACSGFHLDLNWHLLLRDEDAPRKGKTRGAVGGIAPIATTSRHKPFSECKNVNF